MSEAVTRLRKAVVERAVHGAGRASAGARRAAFDNQPVGGDDAAASAAITALLDKVAHAAWTVTDDDVAAATQAGLSDDEIFELSVCAALGQATRQLDAALAALDAAATAPSAPAADDARGVR